MKCLMCFSLLIAFIFPLFNVQKSDIFAVEGISSIYFVKEEDGKMRYAIQEKSEISLLELNEIEGVILTFEDEELDEIAHRLNLKMVREEVIDDMKLIYGYTDLYDDFIYLDGKQTNVQILKRQNEVVAGFPIILSGF